MGVMFASKNRRARVNLLKFITDFDANSQRIVRVSNSSLTPSKTMDQYKTQLYGIKLCTVK